MLMKTISKQNTSYTKAKKKKGGSITDFYGEGVAKEVREAWHGCKHRALHQAKRLLKGLIPSIAITPPFTLPMCRANAPLSLAGVSPGSCERRSSYERWGIGEWRREDRDWDGKERGTMKKRGGNGTEEEDGSWSGHESIREEDWCTVSALTDSRKLAIH